MQTIAFIVVLAAGIWLMAVAVLMASRPHYCLQLFEKMVSRLEASSWRLNITEQSLRILAGVALIGHAPASKLPWAFQIGGWLLVVSSILILVAPIRWHGAYGNWWSRRLTPRAIRVLSPMPAVAGAGLIYAAL